MAIIGEAKRKPRSLEHTLLTSPRILNMYIHITTSTLIAKQLVVNLMAHSSAAGATQSTYLNHTITVFCEQIRDHIRLNKSDTASG